MFQYRGPLENQPEGIADASTSELANGLVSIGVPGADVFTNSARGTVLGALDKKAFGGYATYSSQGSTRPFISSPYSFSGDRTILLLAVPTDAGPGLKVWAATSTGAGDAYWIGTNGTHKWSIGNSVTEAASSLVTNKLSIVAAVKRGTTHDLWVNGVLAATGTPTLADATGLSLLSFGTSAGFDITPAIGGLAGWAAWNRALSAPELIGLAREPWSLFGRRRIWSPVSAPAGTISVPAGALTLTGFAPSVSNSAGNTIDVPAAALTLTGYAPSIASTNVIPVTDANFKFSPYNWATVGATKVAVNGGAYFKLGFTGTSVSIAIDVSSLVTGSVTGSWYPSLRYSVDNGAQTDVQLTSATTALAVTGLSSGTHLIEVWYVAGWWENTGGAAPDRWTTPVYCITVGEATLDSGSSSSAPTWLTNSLIFYGDSIGEGIRSNYATVQPACQNAYDSMPVYLARALECELGNVSFGGLNYNSGFGSIPSFLSGYGSVFNGQTRLTAGVLTPDPAYACIWYGANGNPSQANVETAIGVLRTIAPTSLVCVIVPIGGTGRTNITAAVAAYKASNPNERRVHLIDLGTAWQTGLTAIGSASQQAIDSLHPRANWNARIGAAYAARIASLQALTTTTKTVSLTLTTDGSTAAASLTGLRWAWWDQITPDVMASPPADMGVAETTDGSGVLTITVRSTLSAAGVGWLMVTDSDGTTTQNPAHKLFSGPVAVS